ncbi:hypothetical protein HAX54_020889 [Datura stramonium]|uniref:Uncharacterized protein n=1 Tax=Datura stramonium TaxID=4076 RepID=A0ABS8UU75_DATST|nr:hypothetical protein [Datura stramonium]
MFELQLKIGGRSATVEEMAALEERYPFTTSAIVMSKVGSVFEEPLDDHKPTMLTNAVDDDDDLSRIRNELSKIKDKNKCTAYPHYKPHDVALGWHIAMREVPGHQRNSLHTRQQIRHKELFSLREVVFSLRDGRGDAELERHVGIDNAASCSNRKKIRSTPTSTRKRKFKS